MDVNSLRATERMLSIAAERGHMMRQGQDGRMLLLYICTRCAACAVLRYHDQALLGTALVNNCPGVKVLDSIDPALA